MNTNTQSPQTLWVFPSANPPGTELLQSTFNFSPLFARILAHRGLTDPDHVRHLLFTHAEDFHDPYLLPDMKPAVDLMFAARERGETVFIHGDYDADGVTSTALLYRILTFLKFKVIPHVPHRIREGYGIHLSMVDKAVEVGAKVFLTCDCGIKAHAALQRAKDLGMTVIVTDHHEVPDTLPDVDAIVNPHRKDSTYPFPNLAGVGVAFKFGAALAQRAGLPLDKYYEAYSDLACIGTIADMMILEGENRTLTKLGLKRLRNTNKPGIQALLERIRDGKTVKASTVAFQIGPRLNATGRVDEPSTSLRLLLAESLDEARQIAEEVEANNNTRKNIQNSETQAALEWLGTLTELPPAVIRVGDIPPGVIGLVAGRIREATGRPAYVLGRETDNIFKGSVRSIPGFNVERSLHAIGDVFVTWGGHAGAAGFTILEEKIPEFSERLLAYAAANLTEDALIERIEIDASIQLSELKETFLNELDLLEPTGQGFTSPTLALKNVEIARVTALGAPEKNNAAVFLSDGSTQRPVRAVAWDKRSDLEAAKDTRIDAIIRYEWNSYLGKLEPQVLLERFRPAE